MKFNLMMGMKTDAESMSKGIMTWPKQDIQAHIAFMMTLGQRAEGNRRARLRRRMAWPDQAKLVAPATTEPRSRMASSLNPRSSSSGTGLWTWDSPERAYRIAARASAAPGPGGAPLNMPIEVRQIMQGQQDPQ